MITQPLIVALATGLVAQALSLVASTLLTGRRLRSDLALDVVLAEKLEGETSELLTRDIERRSKILVALARYPNFTGFGLSSLLGFTLICAYGIWSGTGNFGSRLESLDPAAPGGGMEYLSYILIPAAVTWRYFYNPWKSRAEGRRKFIDSHFLDGDPGQLIQAQGVLNWFWRIFGFALLAPALIMPSLAISAAHGWPPYLRVVFAFLALVLAIFALVSPSRSPGQTVVRTPEVGPIQSSKAPHRFPVLKILFAGGSLILAVVALIRLVIVREQSSSEGRGNGRAALELLLGGIGRPPNVSR